ncbi:MAG: TatD family nuclease-associated radical SAM protein, partial [Planctomycetaceae bacterium]
FFDITPGGAPAPIASRMATNHTTTLPRLPTAPFYGCRGAGPARVAWGHDLALTRDPDAAEVLAAAGDPSRYAEVVFCGLGEPMIRLETLLATARGLKARGARIRINTNGHGNLIHGRDVTPELAGLVDCLSISLNAQNAEIYDRDCPSTFGPKAFDGILDFARRAKPHVPEVVMTAVAGAEGVDIEACRRVAEACGVSFRSRPLDDLKEDRRPPDER